ncbi:MAG: hypothetical protein NVSMB49_18690 [Ktedonobacteraceae bacterium]
MFHRVGISSDLPIESVGELIEAIHLQLYIYNSYHVHLALRTSPNYYRAQNSPKVVDKVV